MKRKIFSAILFALCASMLMVGCGKSSDKSDKTETETLPSDEYFVYTLLDDGTYSIGAKDKDNLPETLEFPATFEGRLVTQTTENGFYNCDTVKTVKLSQNFTRLGSGSFYLCDNLETIEIPKSVKGFGNGVLNSCPSLRNINYSGTKGDWENISKAGNWVAGSENYVVNCTDGTIFPSKSIFS